MIKLCYRRGHGLEICLSSKVFLESLNFILIKTTFRPFLKNFHRQKFAHLLRTCVAGNKFLISTQKVDFSQRNNEKKQNQAEIQTILVRIKIYAELMYSRDYYERLFVENIRGSSVLDHKFFKEKL